MKQHLRFNKDAIGKLNIGAILLALTFGACSSRTTPVVVTQKSAPSTTATTTSSPSDPSIYDVSSVTSSDNLFDTTLSGDTQNSASSTTAAEQPLTAEEQACMNNPSYCMSNSNNSNNDDMLFGMGEYSFGAMDYCYQYVYKKAATSCSASASASAGVADSTELEQVFKASQMGLVRCFRNLLDQQMQMAQWNDEQENSYENSDASIYLLLMLLQQGGA